MSSLYPTPKTYAERVKEDEERQKRLNGRLPKLPWLSIPLFGGVVVWLILQFIRIIPEMWTTEDMGPIFMSFSMWLVIFGLFIGWAMYTHKVIYAFGKSPAIFWLCYLGLLMLMLVFYVNGLIPGSTAVNVITNFSIIHAGLVLVLVTSSIYVFNQPEKKKPHPRKGARL